MFESTVLIKSQSLSAPQSQDPFHKGTVEEPNQEKGYLVILH